MRYIIRQNHIGSSENASILSLRQHYVLRLSLGTFL